MLSTVFETEAYNKVMIDQTILINNIRGKGRDSEHSKNKGNVVEIRYQKKYVQQEHMYYARKHDRQRATFGRKV